MPEAVEKKTEADEFFHSLLGDEAVELSVPGSYEETFRLFSSIGVTADTLADVLGVTRKTLLNFRQDSNKEHSARDKFILAKFLSFKMEHFTSFISEASVKHPVSCAEISLAEFEKMIGKKEVELERIAVAQNRKFFWGICSGGKYFPNRYDFDEVFYIFDCLADIGNAQYSLSCSNSDYKPHRLENHPKYASRIIMGMHRNSVYNGWVCVSPISQLYFCVKMGSKDPKYRSYLLYRLSRILHDDYTRKKEFPFADS